MSTEVTIVEELNYFNRNPKVFRVEEDVAHYIGFDAIYLGPNRWNNRFTFMHEYQHYKDRYVLGFAPYVVTLASLTRFTPVRALFAAYPIFYLTKFVTGYIAERRADTFACKTIFLDDLKEARDYFASRPNNYSPFDPHPLNTNRVKKIESYIKEREQEL